ncbi:heat shock protein transcriptional repressor HspR [Microlunatus flavus]|uniref:MerR family transcriptional regulator, heat shock protein HspR n=1 Tax=Microlunatus flavus TaxID=1036181 RepID=A0A1H9L0V6_9ACTN|nr:helix-turn-helix transcriptional regulator [Microlunatus flavus]SER05020.1 MerR family transcriptional regulator, heat shock protein HspR [Microlunatus flavus]
MAAEQHAGSHQLPSHIDHDAPVFVISVAAQLAGMHPQTLRTYDRMGLVVPRRTAKRGRRYSRRDVARLRLVQRLSQDEGVNLEGIRRVLAMQDEIDDLRAKVSDLTQLLQLIRSAPPGSRVFTADPAGGVHMGGPDRPWRAPRAIGSR